MPIKRLRHVLWENPTGTTNVKTAPGPGLPHWRARLIQSSICELVLFTDVEVRDAASQNLGSQHCTGSKLASTDHLSTGRPFLHEQVSSKRHVANKYNEARLCAPPALHQTIWLAVDVRAFAPGTGSVHSSVAWDSVWKQPKYGSPPFETYPLLHCTEHDAANGSVLPVHLSLLGELSKCNFAKSGRASELGSTQK